MKYRKEPNGYKCASCGKDFGQFPCDDTCSKCGCMTSEVKYIYIPLEEENAES